MATTSFRVVRAGNINSGKRVTTFKFLVKVGFVRGFLTGKEPKDGQPVGYDKTPDFEDYGLGCFLLAGAEIYKIK